MTTFLMKSYINNNAKLIKLLFVLILSLQFVCSCTFHEPVEENSTGKKIITEGYKLSILITGLKSDLFSTTDINYTQKFIDNKSTAKFYIDLSCNLPVPKVKNLRKYSINCLISYKNSSGNTVQTINESLTFYSSGSDERIYLNDLCELEDITEIVIEIKNIDVVTEQK